MGVLGCDVSNHQGIVDWPRLAADGIRFAWVKATEGATMLDRYYARNVREARKAGVPVGAYHYAYPTGGDARAEAEHFIRVIGAARDGDLLPVLDFEHPRPGLTPGVLCAWALEWLRLVERALGVKPVLYSFPYYMTGTMGGGTKALREYPLWLADYGPNDGKRHPLSPAGRQAAAGYELVAHQYTSNGRYGGYARLDMNDAPDLERLIVRREPVPPKPPAGKLGPLPGPRKKPAWFWLAVKEYLRRRQKGT